MRHFAARLLSRAAKQDTTQPFRIQDLISPKCALPSRIVKEQHSVQRSALATMARVEGCCDASDRYQVSGIREKLAWRAAPLLLPASCPWIPATGGAGRDRTDGLLLAKQALSQLSYSPLSGIRAGIRDPLLGSLPPIPATGGSGWIRTIDPRLIKTVL